MVRASILNKLCAIVFLSRYLRAARLVRANNQWGMDQTPTD